MSHNLRVVSLVPNATLIFKIPFLWCHRANFTFVAICLHYDKGEQCSEFCNVTFQDVLITESCCLMERRIPWQWFCDREQRWKRDAWSIPSFTGWFCLLWGAELQSINSTHKGYFLSVPYDLCQITVPLQCSRLLCRSEQFVGWFFCLFVFEWYSSNKII